MITKRFFILGAIAAPAIVAASSLMPIRGILLPEQFDPNEIAALLDKRLDIGDYPGDMPFARYRGYDDHVESQLGLGSHWSSEEYQARMHEHAQAELAYLRGTGPRPS